MKRKPFAFVPGLLYLKCNKLYTGRHSGMRYMLLWQDEQIRAVVWPNPWCFEKTDDALKVGADFAPDAGGLAQALAWVEDQYYADHDRWDKTGWNIPDSEPWQPPPAGEEGGPQ